MTTERWAATGWSGRLHQATGTDVAAARSLCGRESHNTLLVIDCHLHILTYSARPDLVTERAHHGRQD